MRKHNVHQGFTVIEILLVMAIFVLLVSIILTNFSTMKLSAQRSAIMTETKTVLPAIEECFLERSTLYCGGTKNTIGSSSNCSGGATAIPVSGTSLCGGIDISENVWPDVERNGYAYTGSAGSDFERGRYVFGLYRDFDKDGAPDNDRVICCTDIGCADVAGVTTASGTICRARVNITNED